MVAQGGEHLSDIKEKLLSDSSTFSFVQAVRLLLHELADPAGGNAGTADMHHVLDKQVRIRPELSLRFPGTDITDIEMIGNDPEKYRITATFLGLYGTSSPLPTFYTEDLLDEWNEDRSIKRDFFDIITHSLYPVFFKIWSKYRLFYKVCEEQDKRVTNLLYCLLGLENDHLRQQIRHIRKFFRYTGLALQMPRSAEGLVAIIEDCFSLRDQVGIEQCIPRKVSVPEDQRLFLGGAGCSLGEDAVVGDWVWDISGKFRIIFFQSDADRLHRFLPDLSAFDELCQLVDFYVNRSLECELVLAIKKDEVETVRLGEPVWSNLGWNTWLLSENEPIGKARTAFKVK